jgi:hypothetical protein
MALMFAATPSELAAQGARRWFPSRDYLVRLLAAPRAPFTGAKLVFNAHGPSRFGNTGEGEVALGAAVPLYLLSGESLRDGLVVGVQGGVFGRFTLTTITRDLITTDWVFAIPFTWRLGDHWVQLRYHHTSAHLGDEYISRFETSLGD